MAGDVADGLIGHPIRACAGSTRLSSDFEAGLRRSGRERSGFDFVPTVCCAIDDDEGGRWTWRAGPSPFTRRCKTYRPVWEMHVFGEAAVAAGDAFRRGDLAGVPRPSATRWSTPTTAAGPLDKVPARVGRRRSARRLSSPADLLHLVGELTSSRPDHRGVRPGCPGRGRRTRLSAPPALGWRQAGSRATNRSKPAMSVSAGPWPGRITAGFRSASLRIEHRVSTGSGVRSSGGSARLVRSAR